MPISSPQRNAPVERVYQAKTRWMQPMNTSSQATNRFTVIPATCGNAIARKPATIIKTLSPMDNPTDFFTMVPTDVALMTHSSLQPEFPIWDPQGMHRTLLVAYKQRSRPSQAL